jgi:hypothetical protein
MTHARRLLYLRRAGGQSLAVNANEIHAYVPALQPAVKAACGAPGLRNHPPNKYEQWAAAVVWGMLAETVRSGVRFDVSGGLRAAARAEAPARLNQSELIASAVKVDGSGGLA